ncbi:MAG: transposase [Thermoplasmata archaeon]
MNDDGFNEFRKKIPVNVRIAFEASRLAYPVLKKLKTLGYDDSTVAHHKELSWIVKSKKKNDHVYSIKLAKLHLVDMLPKSHLLSQDEQISNLKNSIIGYLKREDLFNRLPESDNNFSVKRTKAIKDIQFGDQRDLVLKTMMNHLEFLEKQETPIEKEIKKIARANDDVKLLMTIKGVDYYLASLLSAYIGDITRFENKDRLASFFGVVPASRDTSSIKRRGHISKEGSSVARWA